MKPFITLAALLMALQGFSQSSMTSKDILHKDLLYHFGGGSLLIRISSDSTLYWRDDSKPKEAHEKTKTLHINPHTLMTSWYETDKTFVTMLSDFEKMKVSCMVCRADGKFYPIEGTIEVKK